MRSRIVDKSPTKRIIRDNSPEKRRISTDEIAAAFGAEEVGSEVPHRSTPVASYNVDTGRFVFGYRLLNGEGRFNSYARAKNLGKLIGRALAPSTPTYPI